jgi:flagellar biosynthesis chaperone FliJ
MAFRYRLEVVLRLQRSVERQEENRLLACVAQLAKLNGELRALEEARVGRKMAAYDEMRTGAAGALLQVGSEWDKAVCEQQKSIHAQIRKAEEARLKQLQIYLQVRQKREVLDGLKDRRESSYDLEQLRRVQQSMDDTYLNRTFFWKDNQVLPGE